jgi:hypothetical protein
VRIIGTPQLDVSSLAAGVPTTAQWSLHTPLPAKIVAGTQPLMFTGEAQDASGAEVPVHLISAPAQ